MRYATIIPAGNSAGHVGGRRMAAGLREAAEFASELEPRHRARLEDNIRVLMAGALAQRKFSPRSYRQYRDADDREQIDRLLEILVYCKQLPGSDRRVMNHNRMFVREASAYHQLLEAQTRYLVEQCYWWAIEAVAAALLERKTLSRAEIRAVIAGADPNREIYERYPLSFINQP